VLRGDLGQSLLTRGPVIDALSSRFPATLELAIASFVLALVIAIPIGIVSSTRRNSVIDYASKLFSIIGVSAPLFGGVH